MNDRITFLLQRINSNHLARLWLFYREHFSDDSSCLDFLYRAFRFEPEKDKQTLRVLGLSDEEVPNEELEFEDRYYIPRRMLNTVVRLVSAARDMGNIRHGQDGFKINYLVTCIERLQKLSGNTMSKKEMLFQFFNQYTRDKDKQDITNHFFRVDEWELNDELSFEQFIGVINEIRNAATHEGEYSESFFTYYDGEHPKVCRLKIDLDKFSVTNKTEHWFRTELNYRTFESIFVRDCIAFIEDYLHRQNPAHETNQGEVDI